VSPFGSSTTSSSPSEERTVRVMLRSGAEVAGRRERS
jgi:hypothetical protein